MRSDKWKHFVIFTDQVNESKENRISRTHPSLYFGRLQKAKVESASPLD